MLMLTSRATTVLKPSTSWIIFIFIISALSLFLGSSLLYLNTALILDWPIAAINSLSITFQVYLDPQGVFFRTIVTFITANILIFSKFYINNNVNISRFTHLIIIFVISINILIFFPNLIFTIIGWDGLGITRFLLVIFFHNSKSLKSGLITAFTNRLGDTFILIAIALISSQGDWSLIDIWEYQKTFLVFIVIASITKRAQLPFSAWLPEAMAAPTPVSALVHSSTLVTAGVFLLVRIDRTLHIFPELISFLTFIGTITAYFGRLWGITNIDPKKVVALSTIRQLGLIVAIIGVGAPNIAFFHLITHAIFKSLLFVCVGFSIDLKHHKQSFQGVLLRGKSPFLAAGYLLSLGSLNAAPWTAGFYSKELVLEFAVQTSAVNYLNIFPGFLLLATLNTAIYSIRLWRANVIAKNPPPYTGPNYYPGSTTSSLWVLILPVFSLGIGSLIIGIVVQWYLHAAPIVTTIPPLKPPTKTPSVGPWPTLSGITFALCMCLILKNNWNRFAANMKSINLWAGSNRPKGVAWSIQYELSNANVWGGQFTLPKEWPIDDYPSKSIGVPDHVAEERYFTATIEGLTPLNNVLAKFTLILADNILYFIENGWLQTLGPSNSFIVLLQSSVSTIPKHQGSFVARSSILLLIFLTLAIVVI